MKKYLMLLAVAISSAKLNAQTTPVYNSLAIGTNAIASGANSFATGTNVQSIGQGSFAWGSEVKANGPFSIALGSVLTAIESNAIVLGTNSTARGQCIAIGNHLNSWGYLSTALGSYINTNGRRSAFAIGDENFIVDNFGNDADNQMLMRFKNGYKFHLTNQTLAFSINPSGNIGIGIPNASAKLSIANNGVELIGTVASPVFKTNAGFLSTSAGAELKLASFGFRSGNNSSFGISAYRINNADGWQNVSLLIGHDVDNTQRAGGYLSILGNGNVGIGTPAASEKLQVMGNILASGSITPSDIRYKKLITPLSKSLDKICSLNGVNYFWKKEEYPTMSFNNDKQIGVIAQELEGLEAML